MTGRRKEKTLINSHLTSTHLLSHLVGDETWAHNNLFQVVQPVLHGAKCYFGCSKCCTLQEATSVLPVNVCGLDWIEYWSQVFFYFLVLDFYELPRNKLSLSLFHSLIPVLLFSILTFHSTTWSISQHARGREGENEGEGEGEGKGEKKGKERDC